MSNHTFSSLVELLRYRTLHQPYQKNFTFLKNGETAEVSLTYEELDQQARSIAALLQSLGATGERALLLYPPGLEYIAAFFGCLYAGVVAVPAYPPQFNRSMLRLQAIIADAQAKVVLTTNELLINVECRFADALDLKTLQWLATDSITDGLEDSWQETAVTSNTLAFLQYTSGSTGVPKGVMVSHGNLLHNERIIQRAFEHGEQSIVVGWLPLFHDMGLIGNMLQPLYLGIPCILMSPVAFLQRPLRWLQAISRYKATTSGGPNFAYDLCVRKITPEQQATLDLSSWEVAFNGSETVHAETLKRFAAAFESCGFRREAFYPCYGMAETTLIVSGGTKAAPPVFQSVHRGSLEQNRVVPAAREDVVAQKLVGCGQSLPDLRIVIAHPETLTRCAPDEVGEIWVSGSSVTQGYWNRVEETEHTFRAYLRDTGEGPFLRTGDLGFLKEGELFITGRLKDLIIIRGRNHYPQDIEWTVEQSHPALQSTCGAAFSINVAGEERLVVAQELKRSYLQNLDVDEVIRAIRQAVVENHELQVYAVLLLRTGSILKTSSSKIQRHACRAGFMDGSLNIVGSSIMEGSYSKWNEDSLTREALLAIEPEDRQPLLESYLQKQVARVLGVSPSQLETQQPLITLGLDSLMAVELKNGIETNLGVTFSIANFLRGSSIAQLTTEVLNQLTAPFSTPRTTLAPSQKAVAEHPLSYGQRALWFVHQLAPESPAYNIVGAVHIRADLDIPALQHAFQTLVDRHPSLRTTFTAPNGDPVQQVHEHMEACLQKEDVLTWSESSLSDRLVEEAHRPFNLEQGPLLRVSLFTRSAQEHILLLAVHHIIADFWSLAVLVHELGMQYQAEKDGTLITLAPLTLQYADYVRWQAEMLASPEGKRLWAYWQKQLAGELSVLNLPTDRPRPLTQTYHGTSHAFKLNEELTQRLKALAKAEGATLYMVLLAAFQVLLYRYTDQEDIIVGSPMAGRSQAELAGLVGYFVNPVPLRTNLSGDLKFTEFLSQVRQAVLAAFEHQDYPFALLVERLQPVRDPSRTPLFQVMFNLQKAYLLNDRGLTPFALSETGARMNLGLLTVESIALEQWSSQFDLDLTMAEVDGELKGFLKYNKDLFDASTITRILGHFQTLLKGIVASPEQKLLELPLLIETEQHQLLVDWNDTRDYSQDKCIHQLFEAQVERNPDAIAVSFEDEQISYAELNARSNQIAHSLKYMGIGLNQSIVIILDDSPLQIMALLGVLKAGCAFVCLNPNYPAARIKQILEEVESPLLISESTCLNRHQTLLLHFQQESRCKVIGMDIKNIQSEQTGFGDRYYGSNCFEACSTKNPDVTLGKAAPAYIVYTSGSTGKPKGIIQSHNSFCQFLEWQSKQFHIQAPKRIAQWASISYDASYCEIFGTLCFGATLCMAKPLTRYDPSLIIEWVKDEQISLLQVVPSFCRQMLQVFKSANANGGQHPFPHLEQMLLAGEVLPVDLASAWLNHFPNYPKLFNLYGPTESVLATYYAVEEVSPGKRFIPVGRAIDGRQILILNREKQLCPIGVTGEIYIRSQYLTMGYFQRPEETQRTFIQNPLHNKYPDPVYRTGDLGRWLPDGNIEFKGRIDNQLKIRGIRVELEEIEFALSCHDSVNECAVIAHDNGKANQLLVAYVVADTCLSPTVLRNFLKQILPVHILSIAFVFLDALPHTPNGKIDRKALPKLEGQRLQLDEDNVAPRTSLESVIAKVWQELLHVDKVGVHDNFFELGGHSLMATQIVNRLRELCSVELALSSFFELPTVASLAETIEATRNAMQEDKEKIAQILENVQNLSDIEVNTLLNQVGKQ